jgi:hypothetical protein
MFTFLTCQYRHVIKMNTYYLHKRYKTFYINSL